MIAGSGSLHFSSESWLSYSNYCMAWIERTAAAQLASKLSFLIVPRERKRRGIQLLLDIEKNLDPSLLSGRQDFLSSRRRFTLAVLSKVKTLLSFRVRYPT